MPSYLIGRVVDPILGLATGVMAYVLWENDGRNAHERPAGRTLPELVRRRYNNEEPPASLYAGPEATTRSLFHIPSASHKATPSDSDSPRSTEQIIAEAKEKAARAKGQAGADLRAIRSAVTDEWNQSNSRS